MSRRSMLPVTKKYYISQKRLLKLLHLPADAEVVEIVPNHTYRSGAIMRERKVCVVVEASARQHTSFWQRLFGRS